MKLRADLSVAVGFNDAGGEEGVAVGWHDEAEVHECSDEEFEVFETVDYVCECDLALAG